MKRNILFAAFFLLLSYSAVCQLEDNGISSSSHEKFLGSGVFSKSEVVYKNEAPETFISEFNYGDPVYGRLYWQPGLNNIYQENGWTDEYGYYYFEEIYLNGVLMYSFYDDSKGGRTTLPVCLNAASDDDSKWNERAVLSTLYEFMNPGANEVKIVISVYVPETESKGNMISSASFKITISESEIANAAVYNFYSFKTNHSTGDDIWNDWNVYADGLSGTLETNLKNKPEKWNFYLGLHKGEIKTHMPGDYTKFDLYAGDIKITMRRHTSDNWKKWEISDGSITISMKTSLSYGDDVWKEWDVSSEYGSMNIKTRNSYGDDLWKEWRIEDNLNACVEMKVAVIFLAMFNSCLI